jgi:WD40 repeat protein
LLPSKEWLLTSTEKSVDLASYSAKALADLPELSPPPPANPDLLLVRDGPFAPLAGVAYSADGGKLLVVTVTGRVQRYETESFKLEREVAANETDLRGMLRSGSRFFTFGSKGEVRRWDSDKLEVSASYLVGTEPVVWAVKPDSEQVFLTMTDNKLYSIDLSRRKGSVTTVSQPLHPSGGRMVRPLANVAYFGNATSAIVRWEDGLIGIWKPGDARVTKLLIDDGAKDKVAPNCLATTPTGRYAVIGTKNGYVRLWDTTKAEKARSELAHRVEGKADCITDVVMSEKGDRFLTRGIDGRIILWDVATFKKVKEYTSPPGPGRLCFAPEDGRFVLLLPGRIEQWKLP